MRFVSFLLVFSAVAHASQPTLQEKVAKGFDRFIPSVGEHMCTTRIKDTGDDFKFYNLSVVCDGKFKKQLFSTGTNYDNSAEMLTTAIGVLLTKRGYKLVGTCDRTPYGRRIDLVTQMVCYYQRH